MSWRRTAYSTLRRARAGRLLVASARAVSLKRQGDPTKVRFDPTVNGWIHESAAGVLVLPEPNGRGVRQFEEMTREVFLIHYTPRFGDVVLDIGAGVGTEMLSFSGMVGDRGQVISVEAHPATFDLLDQTRKLGGLSNVQTLQAAVMDTSEAVIMSDMGPELTHMNKVGQGGVSVPAVTIAEIMEKRGLEKIDFLKMNIEGAETAALQGAGSRLSQIRNLAVGCHDFLADETGDESYRTKEDVRALLERTGFSVTSGSDHDPRPWARDYLYARQ